jgi:transcription-repair coupling factor (superfamily II helicase)
LSTKDWEKKLAKANEDTDKIARELLEIYAKRKLQKGYKFAKNEALENDFFNSFEFIYTDDQFNVIKEIFKDMESPFPMDRLISGDVGFGKTEVAFAAIFKAIID